MSGAPKFVESQSLPDVDYAGFATSLGFDGITVGKPQEIGPAWEWALAGNRPSVLDVHCDLNMPPIPPHSQLDQMISSAKALLAGDEDRWGVLATGV